jgi:ABC-type cobalamin/Fe3+-siderophores transport system ATPase subunit
VSTQKERAIALEGASVSFGSISALRGVSLGVSAGEIVAVLGPNGAGKSTLLRAMTGALPVTAGEVRLFGKPVAGLDRGEVARDVAFVSQTADVAFGFTVRDVVTMGRAPHQRGWMSASTTDLDVVAKALARCELGGLEKRRVDELSGGEQKRVAIARALTQSPRVLLLDEPGAFLDVRHQLALYDMLVELAAGGIAVVLSMHDINAAAQYASRVVLLKQGALVAAGAVEEVLTYATLRDTFDADLYCGVNDVTGARFFLPMCKKPAG